MVFSSDRVSQNGTALRELELKFSGLDGAALRVRESRIVRRWAIDRPESTPVKCTYYDTRTRDVRALGLTLRLCEEAGAFTQTVKSAHTSASESIDRFEFETDLVTSRNFPSVHNMDSNSDIAQLLEVQGKALMPYVRSDVERWAALVHWRGSHIEVSIDEGRLVAWPFDGALLEQPLSQIELELISGQPADLFEFAAALARECTLTIETASKEAKGHQLMEGRSPPVPKWGPLDLDEKASVADVSEAWIRAATSQIIAALEALRAGHGQGARQLQQGVRALRLLGTMVPELAETSLYKMVVSQAKRYPALVKDVKMPARLHQRLVAPQLGEDSHVSLQAYADALISARDQAMLALQARAADPETTQFALALLRLPFTPEWQGLRVTHEKTGARRFFAGQLSRSRKRLARAADDLDREGAGARYDRFKTRARHLHMLATATAPLFRTRKRKLYRRALAKARKEVRTASLLHRVAVYRPAADTRHEDLARLNLLLGAHWLAGYARATLESRQKHVYEAARALLRRKPYWR